MTYDDATLMAYADGEGGLLERKRIEQAMAVDPAIAGRVAAYRAMTDQLRGAFAPIAQAPLPDRLTAMLAPNVTPFGRTRLPRSRSWLAGLAAAASLVLGVGLGVGLGAWGGGPASPIAVQHGTLVASGPLAHALDTQLASEAGGVRVLVSFRSREGYCRIFASTAADGIACRAGDVWQLRQTRSGSSAQYRDYRQASSSTDASMLAAAQDMMIGGPLDAASERNARGTGWH